MADNEEQRDNSSQEQPDNSSRGTEWELVSLTASAYAAAPGPDKGGLNEEEKSSSIEEANAGTSDILYMSRHFVFPPSQHENLAPAPETVEIYHENRGGDAVDPLIDEEGSKSDTKNEEDLIIEDLSVAKEFPGIPIFDDKGNILLDSGTELEDELLRGLNLSEKEQSFNDAAKLSSSQSEAAVIEESQATSESAEISSQGLDPIIPNLPKDVDKVKSDETNLPCEAWWKKHASSLYAHAKESNSFWSIFVAAAVMGLVILGHRWQQERWQVLQHKWQFGINDERMSRMLGPLSRLKGVLVGGNQHASFIRGSSMEH